MLGLIFVILLRRVSVEGTLNLVLDLGRIFWNLRKRATVLFTFLVDISNALGNSKEDAFAFRFLSNKTFENS